MKLLVYSFLIISFVFSYQSKENGLAAVVGDEVVLISDLNKSMTDLGKIFLVLIFLFPNYRNKNIILLKQMF